MQSPGESLCARDGNGNGQVLVGVMDGRVSRGQGPGQD